MTDYTLIQIAIGIGITISLLLTETLGVTAGGIIVPGYIGYSMDKPFDVLLTFSISIIIVILLKILSNYMLIYGKRRLVFCLLLGFILGSLSKSMLPQILFHQYSIDSEVQIVGNIIPGLIASWMDRQGIIKTASVILITGVIVHLSLILIKLFL
tara:strand:+ start:87 stop:551 length:465 start_codon:yes stop_codon:yes gene_type:complete